LRKKAIAIFLVAVMILAVLSGCGGSQSSQDSNQEPSNGSESTEDSKKPLKFLAYACITGNNAESGRQVTMAAQTAEWYINNKLGGFPSLGGRPIEIEVLDSTSDAATASLPLERALSKGGYTAVIGNSTSKDNLILGSYTKRTKAKRKELMESVFEIFPILKERENQLAGTLSGGQQQMLAIGRAMMMDPKLLILDEPSLGLAPIVVEEVFRILKELKSRGTSMLIIEQNLVKALQIADRGYVLETGRIVTSGSSQDLLNNPEVRKAYLGIA